MYVEILFRIRTDPAGYLGGPSLERLEAFEFGYTFLYPTKAQSYRVEPILRDWILQLYRPAFGTGGLSPMGILQCLIMEDERAFNIFFNHLEVVLAAHPEIFLEPEILQRNDGDSPPPVSALLEPLIERPRMYLQRLTPGCLRAFLDGYRLALLDEGHLDGADLDGFEHWVGRKRDLKTTSRWENGVLASFQGHEERAFEWTLRELKSYRESRGPWSERSFTTQNT